MARREKFYMPMGTGGLVRYPEEGKEFIKIKPKQLVAIIIIIAVFKLLLRLVV